MKSKIRIALIVGSFFAAGLSQAALLHRYDFETNAADSVGTADATIYGSASIIGGGLYSGGSGINGTLVGGIPNNGALVPSSAAAGITGAFTIELWYTSDYGGGYNTAFSFSDGTTANYVIGCNARGGSPFPSSIGVIGGGSSSSEQLAYGQWADNGTLQHMLVTFDGTTLTYFQNSSTDYNGYNTSHGFSASIDATGLNLSTLPIIGINGGAPWNDNSMNGSVWDFRIYDNAVSPGQAILLFELGQDATYEEIANAISVPDAFGPITGSPTGWSTNSQVTVQAVIEYGASTVDTNLTQLSIDGGAVAASFDVTSSNTTVSYITSLSHGVHTGQVVAVGSPSGGPVTNTWTFELVLEQSSPISLLHHWDFEEGSGTNVLDSAGGANGTIIGNNYGWVDGGLDLYGDGVSSDWNGFTNSTVGSYVDLPNGIFPVLPNVLTFEATYVVDDDAYYWPRIWDFGTSEGGEDVSDTGGKYCYLAVGAPQAGISTQDPNSESFAIGGGGVVIGQLVHVVWVYDADNNLTKFYRNGELVNARVIDGWAPVNMLGVDVNNWFGRSQFGPDHMLNGKLYDIRIYSGIMTAPQVAARYASVSGPGGPIQAPVIESINISGTTVTLMWSDEGVGSYSVLRKTGLTDSSWTTVISNMPAAGAGGASTNFTDNNGSGFFQIMGN